MPWFSLKKTIYKLKMEIFCSKIPLRNFSHFRKFEKAKVLTSFPSSQFHLCCSNPFVSSQHKIYSLKKWNSQPVVYNDTIIRLYSDSQKSPAGKPQVKEKKLSLFQRFKDMYKKYWYVLVPVHVVTSAFWFGGFYYLAKSGVDIVSLLESWNFSEKITNPLKDSSMGYIALAYALYKIATPARYTVTLGGTTISINYLKKWGYIRPVPTTEEFREMYKEKKEELSQGIKDRTEKFRDRKEHIIDDFGKKIYITTEHLKDKKDSMVEDIEKGIKKTQKLFDKKDGILKDIKKNLKDIKEKSS